MGKLACHSLFRELLSSAYYFFFLTSAEITESLRFGRRLPEEEFLVPGELVLPLPLFLFLLFLSIHPSSSNSLSVQ